MIGLLIVEANELPCAAERPYRDGMMLSVPILWTAPDGATPLGVVNLSGRRQGQPFTAGDQKLVAAIAAFIVFEVLLFTLGAAEAIMAK